MKKWLLAVTISLLVVMSTHAAEKIAIVNMSNLFQQVAQKTGVSEILENEFKGRVSELQRIEDDLQLKIQCLHRNGNTMKESDRNKLEKDLLSQRQISLQKVQAFEQDRQRRSDEERDKLIARIKVAVKSVVTNQNIDLVIDANAVAFNGKNIKDITTDVLKQVK